MTRPAFTRLALGGIGTCAMLLASAFAAAACDARFGAASFDREAEYDPFSPAETVLQLNLRARATCEVDVILRRPSAAHRIGGVLTYEVSGEGITGGARRDLRIARLGPAREATSAQLRVTAGQNVGPGRHDTTFEVLLREAEGGAILDRRDATAMIDVAAKTAISVVGLQPRPLRRFPDSPVRNLAMDFGELETGESQTAYVQVRSNGRYALTLDSENGGALAHNSLASTISYEGTLDGAAMDLSGIGRALGAPTDLRGRQHALRILIGDVAQKPAGDYADVVTVTVTGAY